MFADVSLKSQNVRCVGVLILPVASNGFTCVLVCVVSTFLLQNNLKIAEGGGGEVNSVKWCWVMTSLSFYCVTHTANVCFEDKGSLSQH